MAKLTVDEYFRIYGAAGFNLFRFSQRNSNYSLFDDLDHYRERESIFTDTLLDSARRNGFRVMFGFFGFYSRWKTDSRWLHAWKVVPLLENLFSEEALKRPKDLRTQAKEKRFIRYCVARWGVYADFWELLNERYASDEWIATMAEYVHAIDPDRKQVSTSWDKPAIPSTNLLAPERRWTISMRYSSPWTLRWRESPGPRACSKANSVSSRRT